MTTGKKIALLLVVALAAVAGVQKYQDMQLDKPTLVGRCFVAVKEPGAVLMVVNEETIQDNEGKDHHIYGALIADGMNVMPLPPLYVRKLNVKISADLATKRAIEVRCEDGKPLNN